MRNVLATGGVGFIGSNFIKYFLDEHKEDKIINLDLITYAGSLDNLNDLSEDVTKNERYKFIKGDIGNRGLVEEVFFEEKITDVIHFAAESHVDNSIDGPEVFIKTNVLGTFTLLDVAKKMWMSGVKEYKEEFKKLDFLPRFHHISTDEVYGALGATGYFTEDTPYAPNSPYSASKASSDFIVRSYFHTYGMNVVTTNCSNNYGPKQHMEKLIPVIISKAISGENIPIYGDGKNVRDWLYVLDHCKGIDQVFREGRSGETYVLGGHNERSNLEVVDTICSILDKKRPKEKNYSDQITFVKDRAGHDYRYAIDPKKIEKELGWKPDTSFQEGIEKTVDWYLS